MSDEVEFQMTYPCYFLCGDRGGLVCITVNFVTCLCLFTELAKLQSFQQSQPTNAPPDFAFPLEVAFATCQNASELIDRLSAAEKELAASKVAHLAINPRPGEPVPYISIRAFIEALPRE
ncbi:MAG TPA: hypothetical protein VHU84_05300 [Lacipirellulaceae bacterium]|jgi:hypothetical protein|nr:hypothetical protein [Lacipirellulaceae bacterium]